ncbi:MAG: PepSY-associated TM helix domain-containing protein [Candidatus Saccharimonadaceae bacterium]
MKNLRKWSRVIHRDLSFFFAGVIIIYAISGFVLNHKKDFNSDFSINLHHFVIDGSYPLQKNYFTKDKVFAILKPYNETDKYTKHYFPNDTTMKLFLKGGSSLVVDLSNGNALLEQIKKRAFISQMNRLHYNPHKWWTIFSDIFAFSLIVITLTGLFITRGSKGLWGRGGIELIVGIIAPLIFMFFF